MIDWDWIISAGIIIALILTIWARVSHQTIAELITSIKEALADKKDDTVEYAGEVVAYD